jgi:hypothetical protein
VQLDSVRELKAEVKDRLTTSVRVAAQADRRTVAVGVLPRPHGFALAVRVSTADALALPSLAGVLDKWSAETDVRIVGPVLAAADPPRMPPAAGAGGGRRVRPLVPGTSVAHRDVTAGTLGAFVRDAEGRVLLLSNNHVLADTDRASVGDPVLSPAPADGGRPDSDRVATLTAFERLRPEGNLLDLAVAAVDDPALVGGNAVPEGVLAGVVEEVLDGVAVAKTGRTTGHTTGAVTAVELDGVSVDYGRGQLLSFDDCLEVEGDGRAFSAGGDSGSAVYATGDLHVLGVLFAGSTTGGSGGTGLTYCNPAALALRTAGVTLL